MTHRASNAAIPAQAERALQQREALVIQFDFEVSCGNKIKLNPGLRRDDGVQSA